jgi:acetyl-CoA acyltransferase
MADAFVCDAIRTPIGRFGGVLSSVRPDDMAALTMRALMERSPSVDWTRLDDVYFGCANQAGEDNRNVARMAGLLAGLPLQVPGVTVNRLCGSGMDAVAMAARALRTGEAQLVIAGGVESMSRAPFVMGKAESAFSRTAEIFDTTIGWRFINPRLKAAFGTDSMPETAENVAERYGISRKDQDAFALRSQQRAEAARQAGYLAEEIIPVEIPRRKADPLVVDTDEHPRPDLTACALLLASESAIEEFGLVARARVVASVSVGVEPSVMGIGPVPATRKVLALAGLKIEDMDVIELNEAFAAQGLAVMRELGLPDDAAHVNPNGGAIALGHPLGMSGARLVTTAINQLHRSGGRYALCTMCVGVGQGIAMVLERV